MSQPNWDDRYNSGDLPWDTGEVDEHLLAVVTAPTAPRGRAIDIGCGTGTNALWLAAQGYEVVGVDLSPTAIAQARAKKTTAAGRCSFVALDFLRDDLQALQAQPFDLVFDRGCFHVFDALAEQQRFAEQVASLLAPQGVWLSIIGSTEGPARDHGPPRRTARGITAAVEPALELLELRSVYFRTTHADAGDAAQAWRAQFRHRAVAAQPPTAR